MHPFPYVIWGAGGDYRRRGVGKKRENGRSDWIGGKDICGSLLPPLWQR